MSPRPADVEAILFDLGGTCLEIDHPRIAEAVAARGGTPRGDWVGRGERAGRAAIADLLERLGHGGTNEGQWQSFVFAMLDEAGAAPGDRAAILEELSAFHRRHHLWSRVMPGIPETLRALAGRGYRLAVVSNSDGRAEAHLSRLGLAHEFEFILDSHDVGMVKPDARIFHAACARLELPPARVAYVGDVLPIDVAGAQAAGLVPVLLDAYGSYAAPDVGGAPRVAEPAQLLGLFPDRRLEVRRAGGTRR